MNELTPPQGAKTLDEGGEQSAAESTEEQAPALDPRQAQLLMDTLRGEQNLVIGALTGLFATLLGAGIWALVTVVTEYQIGFMAIGIGILVGLAMRYTGKGIDPVHGIVGAVLSLLGCAVGNVLTFAYFIAMGEGMAYMEVLAQLDPMIAWSLLVDTFELMDVLFYGLAAWFGYKYAFRQVTQEDVDRALGKGF